MLITIFLILSFNSGVDGRSVKELEKIVASQFVEVFDRIIRIEKEEIKELKRKDLNNTEKIQFLTQQVEDLKEHIEQETKIRITNTEQINLLKECCFDQFVVVFVDFFFSFFFLIDQLCSHHFHFVIFIVTLMSSNESHARTCKCRSAGRQKGHVVGVGKMRLE